MFYESSELQEIKDSVTKCANKLWSSSKHLWLHVKDGNWTGWITDVNLYISPVLPHCSLDSSIFILTPSAVLILLLSITILDRKTVRTLDFLIPRMPIPQINGTAVCWTREVLNFLMACARSTTCQDLRDGRSLVTYSATFIRILPLNNR